VSGIYHNNIVSGDVEIKLRDWGEYKTTDVPFPRGELCAKSTSMAMGYLGDDDQTAEKFVDGWFCTGVGSVSLAGIYFIF